MFKLYLESETKQMKHKFKQVRTDLQSEIDTVIQLLIETCKTKYNIRGIKGYITEIGRGHSYSESKEFNVPFWAYKKSTDYFIYYTAHELAHQLRDKKYGIDGCHDNRFYEIFCDICPKELQHFELNYKKSSAKYGISKDRNDT